MQWLSESERQWAREQHRRLRSVIREEYGGIVDEALARALGTDEAESRGAYFELRMLSCLSDDHLGQSLLEDAPVRRAPGETTIDLRVGDKGPCFEFLALSGVIVKWFQAPTFGTDDDKRRHVSLEANASFFIGRTGLAEATKLCLAASRKAREKALIDLDEDVWLVLDAGAELLENFAHPKDDDHLREVGAYFLEEAGKARTADGKPNALLACPRVLVAFHRLNRSQDYRRELVVFARTTHEKDRSIDLSVFNLPLAVVHDDRVDRPSGLIETRTL